MKIKVLPEHKRVIATGSYRGKRIKTVAVCNEDNFDERFGIELAKKKYSIAKSKAKIDMHKKNIGMLNKMIDWCQKYIDAENRSIELVTDGLARKIVDFTDFVEDKFAD